VREKCRISLDEITLCGQENYLSEQNIVEGLEVYKALLVNDTVVLANIISKWPSSDYSLSG